MLQRLRIFVSSPADVPNERLRADLIVDKLAQDYGRFFTIESYRWEHEAMLASAHFQDAIEPPSAFDIVVLILWSRLGTPLPEKTAEREYRGIDGRAPVTGTEWEYEEALKAAREKKAPDLLAFRNISPAPIDPRDAAAQAESMAQLAALNAFWTRHFADRGVFLTAFDEYRTLEEFAQRLEGSLRKLIERRIRDLSGGGVASTAAVWTGDPFRGLESYEFEHAPIFFGRDAAVTKATEQLAANARDGHAFLLVSGASGSGKSSLVKAGVVPRLMKPQRISGMAFLRRAVFRPGSEGTDIILGLANALTRADGDNVGLPELIGPRQETGQLAAYLRSAASKPDYLFASALGRLTDAERKSGRLLAFEDAKLILVIDQLEELFTAPGIGAEERRLFIELLAGLARSGTIWVIATLRADFWHRAADVPDLVALAEGQGRIDLAAPSPAELAEMIRRPAQAAGLSFEAHAGSGLPLDAVLAEHAASAPGALPLLSFTLDELYRSAKLRGSVVLTHASYEALGGLEGAIAKRADEIMSGLPAPAQAALPRVVRALTTVTGTIDQGPVARSALLDSFAAGSPARTLIDAFIAARLLVAASEGGAAATVRLAHEALISRWQRARDQLAADRRDLETRTLVERQFERWSQASGGARRQLLLRNPDLANASDIARRWGDELDPAARDFIAASVEADDAERIAAQTRLARERRNLRRARWALSIVFVVVMAALSGALWQSYQTSKREAAVFASTSATTSAQGFCDRALRLAVAGLPPSQGSSPFTYRSRELEDGLSRYASANDCRFRLALSGHAKALGSAAFSPDGSRVVTASMDGTARLWDATTGAVLATLSGHMGIVFSAVFSPDGTRVVTASSDNTARLWDGKSGAALATLSGHTDRVTSAVFSPDGSRIVTASDDRTARLWDGKSGAALATLSGHTGRVFSAVFSPDGSRIVTASDDNTARLWDANTGAALATLSGHTNWVRSAVFSPDGSRIVTASDDHTARLWDAKTGAALATLSGHTDRVTSAVFSPDRNRIVTASDDHTARLWDANTGAALATLSGHTGRVTSAVFSPDGSRVVTASSDNTARLWDPNTRAALATLSGHTDRVNSAVFSPDGSRVVTASDDNTARLWDANTDAALATLSGHTNWVRSAVFSPGGSRIVTASDDNTARLWDGKSGAALATLSGHTGRVTSAVFSSDGSRIVTASWDNTARLWDANTGAALATLLGHTDTVNSAVFSPDGSRVVTASWDNTARLWDAKTGAALATLSGHTGGLNSAVFSPDGSRVVTASWDSTARLWDATTGAALATLSGHTGRVNSAVFSPDGGRVVTASWDNTARLWNAKTGAALATLSGHTFLVDSAVFSPDGSRVVTASWDSTARLWDAKTGAALATLSGHTALVNSAVFSPDGSRIVTASDDNTARLWDGKSGAALATLSGHTDRVASAVFSPDGSRVVTASNDNTARIWLLDPIILMEPGERPDYVCRERLVGAQSFTDAEMQDPILRGRDDLRNPCDRVGPLSFEYYVNAASNRWSSIRDAVPQVGR